MNGSPLEHQPACQLHCLLCYYHQDCKGDEVHQNEEIKRYHVQGIRQVNKQYCVNLLEIFQ